MDRFAPKKSSRHLHSVTICFSVCSRSHIPRLTFLSTKWNLWLRVLSSRLPYDGLRVVSFEENRLTERGFGFRAGSIFMSTIVVGISGGGLDPGVPCYHDALADCFEQRLLLTMLRAWGGGVIPGSFLDALSVVGVPVEFLRPFLDFQKDKSNLAGP